MIISIIYEGFANQLYRYCAAFSTAKRLNRELVLIVQTSEAISDPFQLSEFKIVCSELFVTRTQIETYDLIETFRKNYTFYELNENKYYESVDSLDQYEVILLTGHYQNDKYFEEYIDEIRNMIAFEHESDFLRLFKTYLGKTKSVGVHVRRGDFLYYNGPAAEMDYYKAAMCLIEEMLGIGKATYFVFSDDIDYVKNALGENGRIFYVKNVGNFRESIEEFIALSLCENHILTSASSFSRMADSLCGYQDKLAVYDALGFEWMVNAKDHMYFLDKGKIAAFSKYYHLVFANSQVPFRQMSPVKIETLYRKCVDCSGSTKESELELRIIKAQSEMLGKNYDVALDQLRKLWELVFQKEEKYEHIVHEMLYECFDKKEWKWNRLIENIYLDNPADDLCEKEILEKIRFFNHKYIFLFIPYKKYNPMWYEEMILAGEIIRRMGFEVEFAFSELSPDMEKYIPFNKKLKECCEFIKTRGVNTRCRQVNFSLLSENSDIRTEYINYLNSKKKEIVIVYKDDECISFLEELQYVKKIFWDFSNPFDGGNYQEIGDRIVNSNISEARMLRSYKCSDFFITYNNKMASIENAILFTKDKEMKRYSIADFNSIEEEFVKNIIYFVYKILLEEG